MVLVQQLVLKVVAQQALTSMMDLSIVLPVSFRSPEHLWVSSGGNITPHREPLCQGIGLLPFQKTLKLTAESALNPL
jgi:hypothetical protein